MKTLKANHLGKSFLEQYPKISIKSIFEEIEKELRKEILKIKLEGIDIVYSKTNFGGYRRWFLCPNCNMRVFNLYKIGGQLKCRKCSGLYYRNQKYSKMLEEKVYKME